MRSGKVDYVKLFKLQTDLKSFKYPVLKIIICLSVIAVSIFRNSIFQVGNGWINIIVILLCLAFTLASILCLYISVGEIFHTYVNRKKENCQFSKIKQLTIGTISEIVSQNDIVEIKVRKDEKTIKIGASADCEYTSSVFKDKLFYLSSSEYETVEQFTEALLELFPEGNVPVLEIDGLPFR